MKDMDTHFIIRPYFTIHDGKVEQFKDVWRDCFSSSEENCLYYGFCFNGNEAYCREGYTDFKALLVHLGRIGANLKKVEAISDVVIETHGQKYDVEGFSKELSDLPVT